MNETQQFYKDVTRKLRCLRRHIGDNIHTARKRRDITLEKLARLSQLPPDIIDRLEMGKDEINFTHIVRLSVALRVDIFSLMAPIDIE